MAALDMHQVSIIFSKFYCVPLFYNPFMSLSVSNNVMSLMKRDTERINELLNLVSAECDKVNEPVCLGFTVCVCGRD